MPKTADSTRWTWIALMLVLLIPMLAAATAGQTPDGAAQPQTITLWSTIRAGGLIGYLIILMSLVSVALIVEHFLTIRRMRFLPEDLERALEQHLAAQRYDEAQRLADEHESFLGRVAASGLKQVGGMFGFFDMQNAMQETGEREIARMYRKLDYLSFIAAAAPMLGLLGTVTGMIRSFNQIAVTEGAAKPSQLAGGISEALVTTCMGLVVAIPTMFFVSLFRNRIDEYVAEAEGVLERLMARFRQNPTQ